MASTAIAATIGVASLSAGGLVAHGETLTTWRVWWLGDLGGDLVVAPALLIFASRPRRERRPWMWLEAAGLAVLVVVGTLVAFSTTVSAAFIVIPILLYVALRFRQAGTAIAGLAVAAIAVWTTAHRHGPFLDGSSDAQLLRAQLFVGVAMVSALVTAALATERRRVEERLRLLADHDPVTEAFTRRRFTEELERWIAHSRRYGGQGALMVIDLDRFKAINDAFGHEIGDRALARVAALMRDRLRSTDVLGRLGGDEFAILLPRADEEQAAMLAAELLAKVRAEATVTGEGRSMPITVSIGIGHFGPGLGLDPLQVMRNADLAMYRAKDVGRDRVQSARTVSQPGTGPPRRVGSRSGRAGGRVGSVVPRTPRWSAPGSRSRESAVRSRRRSLSTPRQGPLGQARRSAPGGG
jgi:diguanylate cyclase (GGDEF)-like protein